MARCVCKGVWLRARKVTLPRGVTVVTRLDAATLRRGPRPALRFLPPPAVPWTPSRPLDARKGAPPGMGVEGSVWDQFAWLGSTELGLKLRLLGDPGRGGAAARLFLAPPYPQWASGGDFRLGHDQGRRRVLWATTGTQPDGVDVAFSLQTSPVRRLTARHMFAEAAPASHAKQWDPPNCSRAHARASAR